MVPVTAAVVSIVNEAGKSVPQLTLPVKETALRVPTVARFLKKVVYI